MNNKIYGVWRNYSPHGDPLWVNDGKKITIIEAQELFRIMVDAHRFVRYSVRKHKNNCNLAGYYDCCVGELIADKDELGILIERLEL